MARFPFALVLLVAACCAAPAAAQGGTAPAIEAVEGPADASGPTGRWYSPPIPPAEPPLSCCATIRCASGYKCVCSGQTGGCKPDPTQGAMAYPITKPDFQLKTRCRYVPGPDGKPIRECTVYY